MAAPKATPATAPKTLRAKPPEEDKHDARATCAHPISAHEVFSAAGSDGDDVLGPCQVDGCTCDGTDDKAKA